MNRFPSPLRWRPSIMGCIGSVLLASLLAIAAGAQERPTIVIAGGEGDGYRAAVQRFAVDPGAQTTAAEIHVALREGLEFSSLFEILDEQAFLEPIRSPELAGAGTPKCPNWSQIGGDVLVQGQVFSTPDGVRVEFRLWDVTACKALIRGKRFTGRPQHARRLGHAIADEIVGAVAGRPGVSDTELAFVSDRTGHKEIWVMDADGGNQRAATRNKSISNFPNWSPDGESVVYTSYRYRNRPWLFLVARGSRSPGRILRQLPLDYRLYRGVWHPDGDSLALVMTTEGASEIYSATPEGAGLTNVSGNRSIDVSPAYSPDGKQIAFVSDRTGAPQVYIMDADGSNVRRLTYDGNYNTAPAWSPDGRWIAYETRVKSQFDIWLIDPSGRSNGPLITHRRSDENPTWSPDSSKLAFTSTRRGRADIYVVDVDGSNLRRLTETGENTGPNWGPYRRR